MKEHNEHLAEDYLQKSKMWKDGVWATDIEISLLLTSCKPTSIRTVKHPVKTQHWHGSSFLQAAAATMNNQTTAPFILTTLLETTTTASSL